MTYLRICNKRKTTGATSEEGTATLPEHLSLPPVYYGFLVHNLLVFVLCFVDHYLSFCRYSVDHCIVCLSSIYGF
jgi:hypothetical protein